MTTTDSQTHQRSLIRRMVSSISEASFLNNQTIGVRLTVGFGLLVILTLFVISLSYLGNHRAIQNINVTDQLYVPTALTSSSAQANLLKMRANIHGYLLLGEMPYRTAYEQARIDFETDLAEMNMLAPSWTNPQNNRRLDELTRTYREWSKLPDQMFALRDDPVQNQPALRILTEEGETFIKPMQQNIDALVREQAERPASPVNLLVLKDIVKVQNSFVQMVSHLRGYLVTGDASFKYIYQAHQQDNQAAWAKLMSERSLLSSTQQKHLSAIEQNREQFLLLPPRMFEAVEGEHAYEDRYLFQNESEPLTETMLRLLDEMSSDQQTLLRNDLNEGTMGLIQARWLVFLGGLFSLLLGTGLALIFRRNIAIPIQNLADVAERITAGDLDATAPVTSSDEIGGLATTFNTMTRYLRDTNKQLEDYSHTLEEKVEQRTAALAQAMHEAEEARTEAEDASRAKSQFLANMSHELRTPLNAIIGYSEMLQEDAEDEGFDEGIADLLKIHAAGLHLLTIINDILDISRIEAGKMDLYLENFSLPALVDGVVTTVHPLIEKNLNTLELYVDPTIDTMYADQTKVRQILFNLLSNATKFTHQGHIRLHVQRDQQLDEAHTNERIIFVVEDTGIGIAPEKLPTIFLAFTQADADTTRTYGGTGLGLAISQRFCLMMGGEMLVESSPGTGSTFTVHLPLWVHPAVQTEEQPDALSPLLADADTAEGQALWKTDHKGDAVCGTVLVIDDDESVRELLLRHLVKEGLHVETAANGAEGLERLRALHPDVVTLDVMMPGMDGWEVLTAIKTDPTLADTPVIMLTIVDEKEVGFALGANDYMVKPIDSNHLVSIVNKYQQNTQSAEAYTRGSILVVEDDKPTRELIQRTLQKAGWSVQQAVNGRTALDYVHTHQPDLIILDLMMPEVDGFAVIKELRSNPTWCRIPVVVVTAMELSPEDYYILEGSVAKILQKAAYGRDDLMREVVHMVVSCLNQS